MYGLKLTLFIAFAILGSYRNVHAMYLPPRFTNITFLPPIYRAPSTASEDYSILTASEDYSILSTSENFTYHGGQVMTGNVNLFAVFYGNWSSSSRSIITNFMSHFSSTPTFNVLKSYYDTTSGSERYIDGPVTLRSAVVDKYSQGHNLTKDSLSAVITNHLGALDSNPNNIYLFFPSADVTLSNGFCTTYCSYTMGINVNSNSKIERVAEVVVMPDPLHCMPACAKEPNLKVSPNGQPSIDAMVSDIALILASLFTDTTSVGWTNGQGVTAGIECAGNTGPVKTLGDGAKWNAEVGGKKYLLFETWDIKGQQCRL